jgi:hypothetical protein
MNNVTPIFTFTLNLTEANTILTALQELPAKLANPVIVKLHEQAREQVKDASGAPQTNSNQE